MAKAGSSNRIGAMTIKDIAERARVSITTVSRVLNGKPDVNNETRDRVLQVIDQLKYRPSGVARGLALQRMSVIGFLIRDITDPNFPELARGIVDRARERDYTVMFFDTHRDLDMEREATRIMETKHVDGIIVPFLERELDELNRLHEEGLPIVRIYRESEQPLVSTIALDNVGSAYAATAHLIQLGHRRIAHIARDLSAFSGRERLEGYKRALQDNDLPFDQELVVVGAPTRAAGEKAMKTLLSLPDPPTGVFVAKDTMAIGAYDAIYNAGLAIPGNISIVGHDDIEASSVLRPKLTTMTTFRYDLGRSAADLLFEEMDTTPDEPQQIFFYPELVLRESTAAPAGGE
jgi:LacI family transcriptional regulator